MSHILRPNVLAQGRPEAGGNWQAQLDGHPMERRIGRSRYAEKRNHTTAPLPKLKFILPQRNEGTSNLKSNKFSN